MNGLHPPLRVGRAQPPLLGLENQHLFHREQHSLTSASHTVWERPCLPDKEWGSQDCLWVLAGLCVDLSSNSLVSLPSHGRPSVAGLEVPPPEALEGVEQVGSEETGSPGLPPPPLLVEKPSPME